MASNKEILEAQRYNRRRLVTAFMSGTPGGRELEPRSLGRPLVAGLVIAAVLALVGVVMGRFAPVLPSGWQNDTLVIVKGSGARFFSIDGTLRPVANVTSARLLADPSSFQTAEVDASALDGIPRGAEVGIPEAPDLVPPRELLRSGQWTACATKGGQTHTWVAEDPAGLDVGATAVVSSEGETYLIADGRRHRVADPGVPFALGLESATVHPVDAGLLNVFERGSDFDRLQIPDAGQPATGMPARLRTAVIGSVVQVEQGASAARYVVTGHGRITPLSEVAYSLFRIGTGAEAGNPLTATLAEISSLQVDTASVVPADWPVTLGSALDESRRVCGRLVAGGESVSTELASIPAPAATTPGQTAPTDIAGATVQGGSGALVRATSGGTLGAFALVTDLGRAHGLEGDPATTLGALGYTLDDVETVPAAWLALVPAGVSLSPEAAWQTVTVNR